jgi:hypothetical protein
VGNQGRGDKLPRIPLQKDLDLPVVVVTFEIYNNCVQNRDVRKLLKAGATTLRISEVFDLLPRYRNKLFVRHTGSFIVAEQHAWPKVLHKWPNWMEGANLMRTCKPSLPSQGSFVEREDLPPILASMSVD